MITACLANKLSVSVVGKTFWPVVHVTQEIFLKFKKIAGRLIVCISQTF